MIKVAICGAFDPLHEGHLDHVMKAAAMGDWLIILVSNQDQLILKKGEEVLPMHLRMSTMRKVLQMLGGRGEVRACLEKDTTDCATSLRKIRPNIYAKGGDRTPDNMNQAEIKACDDIGCRIVYGVGGQINSSTAIVNQIRHKHLPGARPYSGHFVVAFDIDGTFGGFQGSVTAEHLRRLRKPNVMLGILCSRPPDSAAEAWQSICRGSSVPPDFIRQCEVDHRASFLRQLANDIRREVYVYVADRDVDKREALRAGWDFYYHWEIEELILRIESTPYEMQKV